jgi:hypothetical protein
MRVVLLTVVLVTACGQPAGVVTTDPLTSSCGMATGTWVNEATRRSKEGDCPRMKAYTRDRLEFDEGAYVSPAAAFIPCSTQQTACTLTVTCQMFDLEMVFTGELMDDATRLVGVATFSGTGACRSAVYDMEATGPLP